MPSRGFELLVPREDRWKSSVPSRFIRRCPSPQPAPARRKLGNPCKFYPVSPHSERYWVNPLRHEACLMSEASYIPADSSVPFLHTPTVYLCTTSLVKQRRRRGSPNRESPGVPRTSSCADFQFKHCQVETLSKTIWGTIMDWRSFPRF